MLYKRINTAVFVERRGLWRTVYIYPNAEIAEAELLKLRSEAKKNTEQEK